jgi:hypothetical protein
MFEVIQSDFVRLESEANASEALAQKRVALGDKAGKVV